AQTEQMPGWFALSPADGVQAPERRRADFERLLELAPSIQEVGYLDLNGTEQVWVARQTDSGRTERANYAAEPWFSEARTRGKAFGAVRFRDGATPVVPLALAERGAGAGVIVALLSLEPVWDVIADAGA